MEERLVLETHGCNLPHEESVHGGGDSGYMTPYILMDQD